MKRSLLMLALMAAVVLACSSVALAQQQQPREQTKPEQSKQPADPADASDKQRGGEVRPDYYIVVLNDDEGAPGVAREHAQSAGASVSHVYRYAFQGYAAKIPKASLDRVKNDSRVQFVEEDKTVVAFEQTLPTGINRIEGDTSTTKAGDGADKADVGAAVIDTGIQRDHPDLNVVGGYNCTSSDRTRWNDGNGHGTHVAGTIGAKDDGQGVVGAAPGAKLYAVKVLNNNGSGFTSWINCGIDWVAGNAQSKGIKVANMSLGGSSSENEAQYGCNSSSMHKAICNAVKNKYV